MADFVKLPPPDSAGDVIVLNMSAVGARGDAIIIGNPRLIMSRPQALNLAAWLVALADHADEFEQWLAAVRAA